MWRDISSAPRVELSEIILWNGKQVQSGGWWEGRWTTQSDEITPQPTHWQPLPAPPSHDGGE